VLRELRPEQRGERAKRFLIAEEARDADQQLRKQEVELVWVRLQERDVIPHGIDALDTHASFDPARNDAGLVSAKIVPAAPLQQRQHGTHQLGGRVGAGACRSRQRSNASTVAHQPGRHLTGAQHGIDQQRRRGAHRHVGVLCRLRVLNESCASMRLDLAQTQAAVAPRPGQHDGDGAPVLIGRERSEKEVDGPRHFAVVDGIAQTEGPIEQSQVLAGRAHVHSVGLELEAVHREQHGQRAATGEQLGQHAGLIGTLVGHDQDRHPERRRQRARELKQGLETAGRRADAHRAKRTDARLGRPIRHRDQPGLRARGWGCFARRRRGFSAAQLGFRAFLLG
jgi:hypothetical protein